MPIPKLDPEEQMELQDELYQGAVTLLGELEHDHNADARLGRAIEILERVVILRPDHWTALWGIGWAWQMIGNHERAYDGFKRCYALDPRDPNVGRELSRECIALGRGTEAVAAAERAYALDSSDSDLLANLGFAYLIDGQVDRAAETLLSARTRDPEDEITAWMAAVVEAVRAHEIEAPTQWPPAQGHP